MLAAIGMVVAKNPVHSAIFLVLTLFNTAGIFVMLGAEFLAAAQVIVYAGAVLVLMLFFLMLIDPQKLPERGAGTRATDRRSAPGCHPVPGGRGRHRQPGHDRHARQRDAGNIAFLGGSTQAFGNLLFTQYLLPFEVVSLVLLIGVVGAIVLALPERLGERLGTISLGHPRGTDLALPEGPADRGADHPRRPAGHRGAGSNARDHPGPRPRSLHGSRPGGGRMRVTGRGRISTAGP